VFFLAVTRETWVGLPAAGLFAVLLAGQWRALRYGHGLTLRAGGIEAAKSARTLVIPWEALAAQPPGRGNQLVGDQTLVCPIGPDHRHRAGPRARRSGVRGRRS
jgi:hypothetical protein